MSRSFDSGSRPLNSQYNYQAANNNPYGAPGGYDSTPFLGASKKKGTSKWIKFGIPVAIVIIAAAVIGGVVGSRKSSSSSSSSNNGDSAAAASSAVNNKNDIGVFPTATDSYGLPVYPTGTNAAFVQPTFVTNAKSAWPAETFKPSNPDPTSLRPDRPRLIAPKYKWDALHDIVASDPYMKQWNDTIMGNATFFKSQALVPYEIDGGLTASGVLDVARQVKERVKAYAYAARVTGDPAWVSRCWDELQNAAGNSSQKFGERPDNWNSQHFLDLAEFTAAFAVAYDWLYDQWSSDQRSAIMWSILELGLSFGKQAYAGGTSFGWWSEPVNGKGNWNCVCNSGMTMGALAILGDDPTGVAEEILSKSIPNAVSNCAMAPTTDGSWTETANYWYFGTTAHSEMTASLITAAGSDFGMLGGNFNGTAFYHMYITGMTSLFNYGDHGPNKYSTTADGMMFYATQFKQPRFMLFQRDQRDAWSDPWNMFNYDPTVVGAWWDGLPLDHFFEDELTQWASMRSTWTSNEGMYIAMKAGNNTGAGHQNHNDLDVGDFVLDAMGQRWAGELGSGDYDAPGYFSGVLATDPRWLYYRKRTEGQNTIVLGHQNQNISTGPVIHHDTTGEAQDTSTTFTVAKTSTAFFTTDMSSAYDGLANSMKRGIRFLNGRKQVLLQDDVDTTADLEWRMHTNASVAISSDTQATLTLGGQTMNVMLLSPNGAKWTTLPAQRYEDDPALPTNAVDQPNVNVTVLAIQLGQGQNSIQVLFNPQWEGMSASDFVTPPSVDIDQWALRSHDSQ